MITGFVKRMRGIKEYENAHVIVVAESNDWTKSNRYCETLQGDEFSSVDGVGQVWAYSRDNSGKGREGVYTDEDEKARWADCIETAFLGEQVCYADKFVSRDPEGIKRKFEEQARFYRKEIREGQDPIFNDPRFRFTGKGNGGRFDDLISIFGLMEWCAKNMRTREEKWQRWAEEHGVTL